MLNEFKGLDWIEVLKPLEANGYYMRATDGKYEANLKTASNTPWYHTRHHTGLNCTFWHHVLFDVIARDPNVKPFVPSECQNCYKVVVKPATIIELLEVLAIQRGLDLPSKAGIETRPYVFGNYGAYWYNIGIEEGRECLKLVRDNLKAANLSHIPIILKRACTEYEHAMGPSDKWQVTPEQLEIEAKAAELIVHDKQHRKQTAEHKKHVVQAWIKHAWSVGDETVKELLDGKNLYPDYVTYYVH